jgi:hypothetical protein
MYTCNEVQRHNRPVKRGSRLEVITDLSYVAALCCWKRYLDLSAQGLKAPLFMDRD